MPLTPFNSPSIIRTSESIVLSIDLPLLRRLLINTAVPSKPTHNCTIDKATLKYLLFILGLPDIGNLYTDNLNEKSLMRRIYTWSPAYKMVRVKVITNTGKLGNHDKNKIAVPTQIKQILRSLFSVIWRNAPQHTFMDSHDDDSFVNMRAGYNPSTAILFYYNCWFYGASRCISPAPGRESWEIGFNTSRFFWILGCVFF